MKNGFKLADLVASEMSAYIDSEECRSMFSRSSNESMEKTASKKLHCKEEHDHKDDCYDADDADDTNDVADAEASLNEAMTALVSVSEYLDEIGFDKTASVAIIAAETLISEAAKKKPAKKDKKDGKKGKFPFFAKKNKKDEKEEDDKKDGKKSSDKKSDKDKDEKKK